jgi:hypothetical protein
MSESLGGLLYGGLTMLGYLGGLMVGGVCGLIAGWNLRGRRGHAE